MIPNLLSAYRVFKQLLYVSFDGMEIKNPPKKLFLPGFPFIWVRPYLLRYLAAREAASRSLLKASRILRRLYSLGFS
jgi:hypothetical protein